MTGDPPSGVRPLEPDTTDGRRQRSQRSRERIIEAIVESLADETFEPRPEHIAARAGVSVSTFFRLLGNREAILGVVDEEIRARGVAHLGGPFDGDLTERVGQLVRSLTAMFETIAPFLRTAERMGFAERRAEGVREAEALARSELERALPPALRGPEAEPLETLALLLTPGVWSQLRDGQGHDPEEARARLERALMRLLGAG